MDGETEAEVVALEIGPPFDCAQAFVERQCFKRSRSAAVVVGRKTLGASHVGINAIEDALLQFLRKEKIDSCVDGIAGRHEKQCLSAWLKDARDGFKQIGKHTSELQSL